MASNSVFTAEKTEIGEIESFSVRRTGWDTWDSSLPWESLADCVQVLTQAYAMPPGSIARGSVYQVQNIYDNYRPQSILQWLDTQDRTYVLSLYYDELPTLTAVLADLADDNDEALDLDLSKLTRIKPGNRFDLQLANAVKDEGTEFSKAIGAAASGSAPVQSVNELTGDIVLDAASVGAAPADLVETGRLSEDVLGDTFVDYETASVTYVAHFLPEGWSPGDSDGGALAAACANGGTVILPPSLLVAEEGVDPARTLILKGSGGNFSSTGQSPSVVEFVPGVDGITLRTVACVGSVMQDFRLSSQEAKVGTSVGLHVRAGRVAVGNITITGFGSHGMHIESPGNPHIINMFGTVTIRGNGGDGLHITGQANACTFSGLDVALNGGWGIWNEGRANEFNHPHVLANGAGAIYDNGIGNTYISSYVEADINGVMDVVRFGPNSTNGIYIVAGYGGKEPVIEAAGGGGWTVIKNDGRVRRHIKIEASGGGGTGRSTVIEQGVSGPNVGRLRLEEADGSTTGTSLMRWATDLLESMIEHRFINGLRHLSATGPVIKAGTGSPEGVLAAPVGSVYQRSDGGPNTAEYIKDSGTGNTGWVPVMRPAGIGTTANFNSVSNPLNTVGKYEGRPAYDTTVDRPIWASGPLAGDLWKYADGTTAATPV